MLSGSTPSNSGGRMDLSISSQVGISAPHSWRDAQGPARNRWPRGVRPGASSHGHLAGRCRSGRGRGSRRLPGERLSLEPPPPSRQEGRPSHRRRLRTTRGSMWWTTVERSTRRSRNGLAVKSARTTFWRGESTPGFGNQQRALPTAPAGAPPDSQGARPTSGPDASERGRSRRPNRPRHETRRGPRWGCCPVRRGRPGQCHDPC